MKNPWIRKSHRGEKRPLQKKIELTSWIILGLFLFLSGLLAPVNFTLGILAGGLISILNFYGLCRGLKAALGQRSPGGAGKGAVTFKYLFRLFLTGIVLYLLLTNTKVNIFGLVIGLATVVLAIVFSAVMTVIDKSYLEEV